jgi:menaquinone-dependent protoporphyrinogen oxidase|tara:strand:+ start:314 stop:844 length:531 start_codon:yes stop_codon:yes gene_type:complete
MAKILFLYSSREGQTKKIFNHISKVLPEDECEMFDLHTVDRVDFSQYEQVLIGASVRYGRLNKKLYQFIERNLLELENSRAAFFCVNLTARKEDQGKDTPEGNAYVQRFLIQSAWKPELIGVFAGALYYPRYNWFDRFMIKLIMTMTGGETDTSKEVEYTNWQKVTDFALQFRVKE